MIRRILSAVAVVVAMLFAALVTTVVATSSEHRGRTNADTGRSQARTVREAALPQSAPAARVDARLARAFAVFRGTASNAVKASGATSYGVNRALSRRVSTAAGEATLIPGAQGACIVVPDPVEPAFTGGTCQATADVLGGQLVVSQRSKDLSAVISYGIVPDGVKAVRLLGPSTAINVNVSNNVWTANPKSATRLAYTDADGNDVIDQLP